jgi:hypothetical protein
MIISHASDRRIWDNKETFPVEVFLNIELGKTSYSSAYSGKARRWEKPVDISSFFR